MLMVLRTRNNIKKNSADVVVGYYGTITVLQKSIKLFMFNADIVAPFNLIMKRFNTFT